MPDVISRIPPRLCLPFDFQLPLAVRTNLSARPSPSFLVTNLIYPPLSSPALLSLVLTLASRKATHLELALPLAEFEFSRLINCIYPISPPSEL